MGNAEYEGRRSAAEVHRECQILPESLIIKNIISPGCVIGYCCGVKSEELNDHPTGSLLAKMYRTPEYREPCAG